ncbi:MAG: hypothetical protein OXF27_06395 [Acidobacteria bacterium]|nr:hypothetical protein [Acidobacteriota bacterium]
MKTVVNRTGKALRIPLSHGRVLRLGPRKEGQIATQDAERDLLKQRVASGEIEIFDDASHGGRANSAAHGGASRTQGGHARFTASKRGDR